ncbi:MAG: hypothetical protein AAGC46_08625 [Solirubrobacteraceae bacterium]|nr:hypothetical protein [Patulibacter sp.]
MSPLPNATPHRTTQTTRTVTGEGRVTAYRALAAVVWAVAFVAAVGDRVPTTHTDMPVVAAILLATYPLIDVVASTITAASATSMARVLRVNAGISAVAAVAIAVAAFAGHAGAALAAFGIWAAASGAIQFGVAVVRRRAAGGQWTMLISGGLSTVAGIGFLSAAGMEDADLARLGAYMAFGAVLYVVSTIRRPAGLRVSR